MPSTDNQHLFKALGLFLEEMRDYVITTLVKHVGDRWPGEYQLKALHAGQQDQWNARMKQGSKAETLIDFGNLKGFALGFKFLLNKQWGKEVNNLPTWFDEIANVRNKCQHFDALDKREIENAYYRMEMILTRIGRSEAAEAIRELQKPKENQEQAAQEGPFGISGPIPATYSGGTPPWFLVVRPHLDIRQGRLDESVFAANLAEVAFGGGREIYQNSGLFFQKTYFTQGLRTVARRVISGLNGGADAENRVISLQTGFGGGKTHTLISLYHLAKMGNRMAQVADLRALEQSIGTPEFTEARVAVFTNSTNDPVQGRKVSEGVWLRTLWGELAWQLGGEKAYEVIRANDEARTAPKGLFRQVLAMSQPSLILLDELADYCVAASAVQVGASTLSDQTISFIQELTEAVSGAEKCVMVATLPASITEVANSESGSQILNSLQQRLARVGADTKPVSDEEIFHVIRYRLFESTGDHAVQEAVISSYFTLYQEISGELPNAVSRSDYKDQMRKAYPFHPELIEVFRTRWASHHGFQRTRGVLRILASIVADLWKRQGSLPGANGLIHPSDVNFADLDLLRGQITSLYGNGYDAVISADVSGSKSNAFQVDQEKPEYGNYRLAQGMAACIMLGSFGADGPNKGMGMDELKLAVLRPDTFNHNNVNGALDALEAQAYYLYFSSTGTRSKRYWFHTKPNINILISKARTEILSNKNRVNHEILDRMNQHRATEGKFRVLINPGQDVPEQQKPTIIVLPPEYQANGGPEDTGNAGDTMRNIATRRGNSERIYKNVLLFLVCSEKGYVKLADAVTQFLACQDILTEYRGQLDKDQQKEMQEKAREAEAAIERHLAHAYHLIFRHSAKNGLQRLTVKAFQNTLRDQIDKGVYETLKEEEWMLDGVGLGLLQRNNLLPTPGRAIRLKDVADAFIQFDDKPMILSVSAVTNSVQKFCREGHFAIGYGDGKTFTKTLFQESLLSLDVADTAIWLVDKSLHPIPALVQPEALPVSGPTIGPPVENPEMGVREPVPVPSIKAIQISGKVDLANWSQIFTSFLMPLRDHLPEIQIVIRAKGTPANPLDGQKAAYKIAKESASQLGLKFEEE